MKLIKQIWNSIDDYFSSNERKKIRGLKKEIKRLRKDRDSMLPEMEMLNDEIVSKESQIEDLWEDLNKCRANVSELQESLSEETYDVSDRKLGDFLEEDKTKYEWRPRNKVYLHKTLNNFSQDNTYKAKYLDFLENTLGLNLSRYNKTDDLVYRVYDSVQDYINEDLDDDYKKDKEVFHTSEYWLTPQGAYEYYVEKGIAGDCDDSSAFLYGAIVTALIVSNKEDQLWRLKRYDCKIMAGGGHALLIWLREDGDTWSPIESTFGEKRRYYNWKGKIDAFKSMYTINWHIFDEETEYKLK